MLDGSEIIHLERAKLLIDIARWREAIHELHKYLTYFSDDYHTLCQISRCHYELSEFKDAMKYVNRAIESNPENEWAYRLQSLIYHETGENDKSLVSAEICVQKAPNLDYSLQTLAYAQIRKFRLAEAGKTVTAMLEVSPDAHETHDACGYLALKKEEWQKAETHYRKALSINALSANSLNNLGVVYLNQVDTHRKSADKKELRTKAIECFEQAIKVNPNYHLAHDNLKLAKSKSTISPLTIFLFVMLGFFLSGILRGGGTLLAKLFEYFTPYSTNFLILLLNIYFIFSVLFVFGMGILIYTKGNKEQFNESLKQPGSILILLLSQFVAFLLLIIFGFFAEAGLTPFSTVSMIGFAFGTLFCAGKFIIYMQTRHLENE